MKGSIADFIQVKGIDSFQKLRLLLFLYQRPEVTKSLQQLAERLYLGHLPLLERIINDLWLAGLLERVESRYQLADDPQVRSHLKVWLRSLMTLWLDNKSSPRYKRVIYRSTITGHGELGWRNDNESFVMEVFSQ